MATAKISTRLAIHNILCALDLSPDSERILDYAQLIARRYDARLYIAHVVPHSDPTSPPVEMLRPDQHPLTREAHQHLAQLATRPGSPVAHSEILVGRGLVPGTVLLAMIPNHSIDFVVLGTTGRKGWDKFMLGSVAEQIFEQVNCPVLTVGPKALRKAAPPSIQQVLFPTDLSPESRAGLPYALSLAQEYQALLTLLFLVHPDVQSQEERLRFKGLYEPQLRALIPAEVKQWCNVEYRVDFDVRAKGIVRIAGETGADVIVLGVRGSQTFAALMSHLPGPTAYEVVSEAPCPVLTVRAG